MQRTVSLISTIGSVCIRVYPFCWSDCCVVCYRPAEFGPQHRSSTQGKFRSEYAREQLARHSRIVGRNEIDRRLRKSRIQVAFLRNRQSMITTSMHVQRTATILRPDQSRVLLRPFRPETPERAGRIIARIMSLPESEVGPLLQEVFAEFSQRHQHVHTSFLERFEQVRDLVLTDEEISEQRQLLIGSYFVCEFSLESAALFNPSIVPHPDQSDLSPGALRFILSLRATGEGHISSITFRTGIIHSDNRIEVQTPTGFLTEPRQIPNPHYEKALFERKLFELGLTSGFTRRIMDKYGERFSLEELRANLEVEMKQSRLSDQDAIRGILMLARSNYEVQFQPQQPLSERILFPGTPSQRTEDAGCPFPTMTTATFTTPPTLPSTAR